MKVPAGKENQRREMEKMAVRRGCEPGLPISSTVAGLPRAAEQWRRLYFGILSTRAGGEQRFAGARLVSSCLLTPPAGYILLKKKKKVKMIFGHKSNRSNSLGQPISCKSNSSHFFVGFSP